MGKRGPAPLPTPAEAHPRRAARESPQPRSAEAGRRLPADADRPPTRRAARVEAGPSLDRRARDHHRGGRRQPPRIRRGGRSPRGGEPAARAKRTRHPRSSLRTVRDVPASRRTAPRIPRVRSRGMLLSSDYRAASSSPTRFTGSPATMRCWSDSSAGISASSRPPERVSTSRERRTIPSRTGWRVTGDRGGGTFGDGMERLACRPGPAATRSSDGSGRSPRSFSSGSSSTWSSFGTRTRRRWAR